MTPRGPGRLAEEPLHLAADWSGARITVMGLGLFGGGAAVARAFARRGARVTVTDKRTERDLAPALAELEGLDLAFALGGHRLEDFTRADLVVANPAVPPDAPELRAARAAGVAVGSEAALFLASCPSRLVLVTGTQGKSSVANALAQMLAASGVRAHLGGNVGRPLLDRVEELGAEDVVVLELSSYQLEALPPAESWRRRAPRVEAVSVTNVLADHIERHKTVALYRAAKRRILELLPPAGGAVVLPAEDPELAGEEWRPRGARRVDAHAAPAGSGLDVSDGVFRLDGEPLGRVADVRLPGRFQRANVLVALGLARLAGAAPERLARAVGCVTGLPHRLEDLGLCGGHRVWDNGVSTTPDSTEGVLDSLAPGFALLCGGQAKALPLEGLARAAAARARRAVVFGAARETLARAFRAAGLQTHVAETLEGSVALALEAMEPGEELLFSPACASFDAFVNFRARALAFRAALAPGR